MTAALFLALIGLGTPAGGWAQGAGDARTFGQATVVHTLPAASFVPIGSVSYVANSLNTRWCQEPCIVQAGVVLPAGAVVTEIQLEACDLTDTHHVTASLGVTGPNEGPHVILASVDSGITEIPNCFRLSAPLATPHTIDNLNNTYTADIGSTGSEPTHTRWQALRIFYHLQLSPPPGVASFADVPTDHPFFPFIEALAAAGITGGCSVTPPLFCPDDPLTRGQAAAFFGRALGLQFAP